MALAEPRLRAGGLSGDAPERRPAAAGWTVLAAVLWDMDGTLVDTEPYWIEAEFELVERHGGTWTHEHALNLVGNDLLDVRALHPRARRHRPRPGRQIVEELLDRVVARVEREVPWRPGAVELLADLRDRGVPLRAGDDVLPPLRGADPRRAPDGDLRGRGHRRHGQPAASRTPSPT